MVKCWFPTKINCQLTERWGQGRQDAHAKFSFSVQVMSLGRRLCGLNIQFFLPLCQGSIFFLFCSPSRKTEDMDLFFGWLSHAIWTVKKRRHLIICAGSYETKHLQMNLAVLYCSLGKAGKSSSPRKELVCVQIHHVRMIYLVSQSFSEQHLYVMFIVLQNGKYHLWLIYEGWLSYTPFNGDHSHWSQQRLLDYLSCALIFLN